MASRGAVEVTPGFFVKLSDEKYLALRNSEIDEKIRNEFIEELKVNWVPSPILTRYELMTSYEVYLSLVRDKLIQPILIPRFL